MPKLLKIALWNANGLSQHKLELNRFIIEHKIDILLISESHFTDKNYFSLRNYKIYDTKHPDGTAHGGSAIIIKNTIRHYELPKYQHEHIQATNIVIQDWNGPLTISALYSPPKHNINKEQYLDYYKTLGKRFIAGGDYNAKHTFWGSRIITQRGRQLLLALQEYKLNQLSTGKPTYWPTDTNKIPDLLDFCVTKGIPTDHLKAVSSLDLSSDHTPVIICVSTKVVNVKNEPKLHSKRTNWYNYRNLIESKLTLNVQLRNSNNISEAIDMFCKIITEAAKESTPEQQDNERLEICPAAVKLKIEEKRRLRKLWQITRSPQHKTELNRTIKELRNLLKIVKEEAIQTYLKSLTPTESTDYSLWKTTRKLKQPQQHVPPLRNNTSGWARSDKEKAELFALHLENTFKPYPSETTDNHNKAILDFLDAPLQLDVQIEKFTIKEAKSIINKEINPKKSPGYDKITGKMLKELPEIAIKYITFIFNAILRTGEFPTQWKKAVIILLPKPGKSPYDVKSYRPISLLPILSKVFEKLFVKRLKPILENRRIIPNHQFGFRQMHATTEQIHRVVNLINNTLEEKKYCSAAFLDITQAFDKVWHTGLLYKLKKNLPYHFYILLRSYLKNREFIVKYQDEQTTTKQINSGVPQGSVLGPLLYLIYTADLPLTANTTTTTFADDTAVLASHDSPHRASAVLQINLNEIQEWLKLWRIKVNEGKSVHVTFTNRKGNCPPVNMNNKPLVQAESAKYLGMHLDRRLNWKAHIMNKNKQLRRKFNTMYWLLGRSSQLSLQCKVTLYKCIIKPIWTYGMELWGTASNSNIEILERFQSKVLRSITKAPWYIRNEEIRKDLNISTVKKAISDKSQQYYNRLQNHPNLLALQLSQANNLRRLKRHKPSDLISRFVNTA